MTISCRSVAAARSASVRSSAFGGGTVVKEDRTPDKSEAAVWIETMWPATLTNIADESGFARSHVRNTLDLHFEVDALDAAEGEDGVVNVPEPIETAQSGGYREEYRDGYRDGFSDAQTDS